MNKMVEVELYRWKNLIFGTVLHVDESLTKKDTIARSGKYTIYSVNEPQIADKSLYLHGIHSDKNNQTVCYVFDTIEDAEEWVKNIKKLLDEINNREVEKKDKNEVIRVI